MLKSDLPEVLRMLPGVKTSRKHRVSVTTYSNETPIAIVAACWDGGSLTLTSAYRLTSRKIHPGGDLQEYWDPVQLPAPGRFSEGFTPAQYLQPDDVVLVETGSFCGKTATPHIQVPPALAEKLGGLETRF